MKKILALGACVLPLVMAPAAFAQTSPPSSAPAAASDSAPTSTMPAPGTDTPAPASTGSVMDTNTAQAVTGVSVKHKIMGKSVYNEKDEKIGDVEDIVLGTGGQATTYVIGAGGFLGMGQRSVAVPYDKVTATDDKLLLQGFTKEQLKALPEVKVAE